VGLLGDGVPWPLALFFREEKKYIFNFHKSRVLAYNTNPIPHNSLLKAPNTPRNYKIAGHSMLQNCRALSSSEYNGFIDLITQAEGLGSHSSSKILRNVMGPRSYLGRTSVATIV